MFEPCREMDVLEEGIIRNGRRFSGVFKRIFQKYGRHYEEEEVGGMVIDMGGLSNEEFDVVFEGNSDSTLSHFNTNSDEEDEFDPKLAALLHSKVVQVKKEINWDEEEQKHQQSKRQKMSFYPDDSEDSDSDGLLERSVDNFRSLAHKRRVPREKKCFHLPYLEKLRHSPPSKLTRRPHKRARSSLDSEEEENLSEAVLETEAGTDWADDFESSPESDQELGLFHPDHKAEFVNLASKLVILSPENEDVPQSLHPFPASEDTLNGYESGYHLPEEDSDSGSETHVFIDIPKRIKLAHVEKSPAPPLIDSSQFDMPLDVITCSLSPTKLRDDSNPKTITMHCKRILELKSSKLQVSSPNSESSRGDDETTSRIISESTVEGENLKQSPLQQCTNSREIHSTMEPLVDPDPILPIPLPRRHPNVRHRQHYENALHSKSLVVPTSDCTALHSPTSICNYHSLPSSLVKYKVQVPSPCTCCPGAVDCPQCNCCYSMLSPCWTPYPTSLCCGNYETFLGPRFTYCDNSALPPLGPVSGYCHLPISDTPCRLGSGPSLATTFVQSNL